MTQPVIQQTVQGKDETGAATTLTLAAVDMSLGGASPGLFVDVTWRNNASQTITDVTHNGTSIVSDVIGSQVNSSGGSQLSFRRIGSSASGSVVITFSAAIPSVQGTARVTNNTDQTTPVGDIQTSTGTGTASTTATLSTTSNDLLLDQVAIRVTPGTITAGANQTETSSQATAATIAMKTSTQSGADGGVMDWTWTNSQAFTHKAYNVQGTGGVTPNKRMLLLGVG